MKITIEILEKAKAFAKNHIDNIDNYKDTESDPYELWDNIDGFDINLSAVPAEESALSSSDVVPQFTWRCCLYTGEYDSQGYWKTNYQDYVPFYIVGDKPIKFLALTIDKLTGATHWTPTKESIDDLIAHFKRYPAEGKDVIVHWLDDFGVRMFRDAEEQLTRTTIEL